MKIFKEISGTALKAPVFILHASLIFEEITAEKVPNMAKERVIQVQEAQRVPGRINPR